MYMHGAEPCRAILFSVSISQADRIIQNALVGWSNQKSYTREMLSRT